jgi:UDP-glucose 4-epimerase
VRLFVTGATGFIGSHFVHHAIAAGHDVIGLRRTPDSRPRIALTTEPCWLDKSLSAIDQRDLASVDCLVHLAAAGISPRTAPWSELLEQNVAAPTKLLETALAAGVNRWVITGSFAEYGDAGLRYDYIPPDAPLEPTFPYAASKAAGSLVFQTLARQHGAQLAYLRLFSVYGEGQHEANLWPMLQRAAPTGEDVPMTPGEQLRDFVSVEQVAAELLAACCDPTIAPGAPRVTNVGSGQPQTVRQFAEYWWRRWNAKGALQFGALPYRDGEVMRYVPELAPRKAA